MADKDRLGPKSFSIWNRSELYSKDWLWPLKDPKNRPDNVWESQMETLQRPWNTTNDL